MWRWYQSERISKATERTIKIYLRVAALLGHEEADWKYEWKDGGRVMFLFRTPELRDHFDSVLPLFM